MSVSPYLILNLPDADAVQPPQKSKTFRPNGSSFDSFIEFSQNRTLNRFHSPSFILLHQENCTTFLLVSWEEETQNLVSVVIKKKNKKK